MISTTDPAITHRIANARGWMLDVDGCLVYTIRGGGMGGQPIEGAVEFLHWLHGKEKRVLICTNASQRPDEEYAAHLNDIGLIFDASQFMTAAGAAAYHIRKYHGEGPVVAVGDIGLFKALERQGVRRAGDEDIPVAVIVGSADHYASADINAACLAIADHNAAFYVSVDTPWFYGGRGRSVASSTAIARAIHGITAKSPQVCGKPSTVLAGVLRDRLGGEDGDIVIIGDMASIEMRMARAMGALGVLVLSGGTAAEDLPGLPDSDQPHLTVDNIGGLLTILKAIPDYSPGN
ncbi:MAG: HAD hydrolase-like protein [Burkholderiales bacterium]|nr:HAD hydrolase-like protein [Burkholderiales bacterium]MBS0413544.1 HAD hydrolase-like protein [Pseudomonadota bacterium]